MKTLFALQAMERSIFLAGPSSSVAGGQRWRKDSLLLLKKIGFTGTVMIPEKEDWQPHNEYDRQVEWEFEALNAATVVVFWVPRNLPDFPAFTTNTEFGLLAATGKVVLGFPENAEKMRYLAALADRFNIPVFRSLEETLVAAVTKTQQPFSVQTRKEWDKK